MKKILIYALVVFLILIVYKGFQIIFEGSIFNKPKLFYSEDPNTNYKITVDDTAGYYFIEGNNSYPDRKNTRN